MRIRAMRDIIENKRREIIIRRSIKDRLGISNEPICESFSLFETLLYKRMRQISIFSLHTIALLYISRRSRYVWKVRSEESEARSFLAIGNACPPDRHSQLSAIIENLAVSFPGDEA